MISNVYKGIAILILAAHAKSEAIGFLNCPQEIKTTGILSNVIIPSCEYIPCTFKKGNFHSIEIDFENVRDTVSLRSKVFGIISGVVVPWSGIDSNGCNNMLIGSCPLKHLDYVTYGYSMFVNAGYPTVDATVRWIIEGDDGEAIFCFQFPAKIR